jgi:hypothetical protein
MDEAMEEWGKERDAKKWISSNSRYVYFCFEAR